MRPQLHDARLPSLDLFSCLFIPLLLFFASPASAAPASDRDTVTLGFTGDVMLAYEAESFVAEYGYQYPFLSIFPFLESFNLLCGNLECPVSDSGTAIQNKDFYFKMPIVSVAGLKFAGFDVMGLANNHILDFGDFALFRTMQALTNKKIVYVGGGRNRKEAETMKVKEVNGVKVGYLAFSLVAPSYYFADSSSAGTATCGKSALKKLVSANRPKVDVLVVVFHWGVEYEDMPNEFQTGMGHAAIDAGANLVIGHHPHVLQPVERYGNGLIAYSLGNFAFGSFGRPPERTADIGLVVSAVVRKKKLKEVRLYPVNVFNYEVKFQPCLFTGERSAEALKRLSDMCGKMKTELTISSNFASISF